MRRFFVQKNEDDKGMWQATLTLPHFHYKVPVLYLSDGAAYIPVVEFCKMLGLRAETHIPRWRRLMVWCHARKLPWRTPTGRTHIVWCLHLGALPFLCACFNWSLVPPTQQAQLREATDAWLKSTEQAQQELLTEYRQMRHLLFEFLAAYANAEDMLSRSALQFALRLNSSDARIELEQRLSYGRTLIQQATDHARHMLHDQAAIPILDVVELGRNGEAVEIGSLPLFPAIPREERAQFLDYLNLLSTWHREFAAFLKRASAL
jgi:hypothetical protein